MWKKLDRIKKWLFDPIEFFLYLCISLIVIAAVVYLTGLSSILAGLGKQLIDIDDARYLLSSIIQALAAILAIVVTITLVGVQIASQTYTHKLQNYFIKSRSFWTLLIMYVSTILICSLILLTLKNLSSSLSFMVTFSAFLFMACLLYLGAFIKDMASLLSLNNVVDELLNEVNKSSFSRSTDQTEKEIGEEMMPVFDIIINALNRNDYGTARLGINKIKSFFIDVLLMDIMDKKDKDTENQVNVYLSREIKRISKICILRDEEDVFDLIISSLGEMGTKAAEVNFIDTAKYMMGSLVFIGEEALSKKWCSRVTNVSTHLQIIGRTIINSLPENPPDMDQEEAFSVFKSIECFGSRCLSLDFIDEATYALNMIGTLEKHINLEKFNDRTRQNIKDVYPSLRDKISSHK